MIVFVTKSPSLMGLIFLSKVGVLLGQVMITKDIFICKSSDRISAVTIQS